MKIRNKLIISFCTMILAAAVAGYFIMSSLARSELESLMGSEFTVIAEGALDEIDRAIESRLEQAEAYAIDLSQESAVEESNREFDEMADREGYIREKDSEWMAADEQTDSGFVSDITNNDLANEIRDEFQLNDFYKNRYGYEIYPEVFLTNKYGLNIAQTQKTTDYYQADETWWQEARDNGVYVEDVEYDESSGVYSLSLCVAMKDGQGGFLGVLKAVYSIEEALAIVEDLRSNPTEESYTKKGRKIEDYETTHADLLDGDGRLIFSTLPFEIFESGESLIAPFGERGGENHIDYYVGEDERRGHGEELIAHAHSRGYKDFNGLDWILVIELGANEAFAPADEIANTFILIVAALAALFLIIALIISESITKPIRLMKKDVEVVAGGNLDHEVKTTTKDEVGDLARAFNRMVSSVKKSRAEVDERVKEQTSEIIEREKGMEDQRKAILNILEDVDEEKKSAVVERDKTNAILGSIGDAVLVVDKDFKIILVNKVTCEISGYSKKELFGKKYDEVLKFVFESDGKTNNKFIHEAISTGKPKDMSNHTDLITKDGGKVPVSDSAAPLIDDSGEVIGCVVVFRDVSKEREIDRMKTEFVSVASHQLRTPLTTMNWYIEMLLSGDAGELNNSQSEYLNQVMTSSTRMVKLVNDLLNVSRIETGRLRVDPKPTSITAMINDIIDEVKPLADNKGCKIKFHKPKKALPKISIDPGLIRQVIHNMVTNAIKYSTGKVCSVTIRLKQQKDEYLVSVKDSGIGIPKGVQHRIFEKFYRADNAVKTQAEGSGLGLYIAKMIVEAAGGKIWFDSKAGKGTTFFITIPKKGMKKKKGARGLA